MRQVFSSPRLENVEAVARLLEAQEIEVRISNGRSYRSAIRGNFSYRDRGGDGERPAVWVVKSEDQPKARQLLRDAGLLQSARMPGASYLPDLPGVRGDDNAIRHGARAARIRFLLIAAIAAVLALAFLALGPRPDAAPGTVAADTTAGAPAVPMPVPAADVAYRIATPPALAEMLFAAELAASPAPACLAIDGGDPPADLLERLRRAGADVRAASACSDGADGADNRRRLEVADYRTDGSGVGTVAIVIDVGAPRRLSVERIGDVWRVLGEP